MHALVSIVYVLVFARARAGWVGVRCFCTRGWVWFLLHARVQVGVVIIARACRVGMLVF